MLKAANQVALRRFHHLRASEHSGMTVDYVYTGTGLEPVCKDDFAAQGLVYPSPSNPDKSPFKLRLRHHD
jgi:hypothetical protein